MQVQDPKYQEGDLVWIMSWSDANYNEIGTPLRGTFPAVVLDRHIMQSGRSTNAIQCYRYEVIEPCGTVSSWQEDLLSSLPPSQPCTPADL